MDLGDVVLNVLSGKVGVLDVERLLVELLPLPLVHALLLENDQGAPLHGVLGWTRPHFANLSLVLCKLSVQLSDSRVDA